MSKIIRGHNIHYWHKSQQPWLLGEVVIQHGIKACLVRHHEFESHCHVYFPQLIEFTYKPEEGISYLFACGPVHPLHVPHTGWGGTWRRVLKSKIYIMGPFLKPFQFNQPVQSEQWYTPFSYKNKKYILVVCPSFSYRITNTNKDGDHTPSCNISVSQVSILSFGQHVSFKQSKRTIKDKKI